jgi:hypothetical protein
MESCKTENRSTFKNLFTSILMSEESSSNSSGNGWQTEYFYNILLGYIQKAIPTKGGDYSDNSKNVKINKLNPRLSLDLANFGLTDIHWFEWSDERDKLLIEEATKTRKLGIEEWDVRNIVENANLESINEWIANQGIEMYGFFLSELEKIYLREETINKLFEIKLFKFSDDNFYSINDVWAIANVRETYQVRTYNQYQKTNVLTTRTRLVQKRILNQSIIFNTDKSINISEELKKLGFAVSLINISSYKKLYSALSEKLPKEKDIYNAIAEKCKTNTLSATEKENLFLNFINEETKFENLTESTLRDLELFSDNNSEIKPLKELIFNGKTPSWLNAYKINGNEYFAELDLYLVSDTQDIFKNIYKPNENNIISEITTAEEIQSLIQFYRDNDKLFFKEFIITKRDNKFVIKNKTNEYYQVQPVYKEVRNFLIQNCSDNLFVILQSC